MEIPHQRIELPSTLSRKTIHVQKELANDMDCMAYSDRHSFLSRPRSMSCLN